MKRVGRLFEKVVDFHALCSAGRRAARGKGRSQSASAFLFNLEGEVLALQRELLAGTYRPRPYRTFHISDPKPRTISAADFRDRVAHHALCAALEPRFERAVIFDSYACRTGKGSRAAAARAQEFARRHGYFLKLDIRKFFETVDHALLEEGLRRVVGAPRVLALADTIIAHGSPGSAPGKGLPIGNLTSQHFANNYLCPLDHFVKEFLRVPGYIRYMDDFLLFSNSKLFLRDVHDHVREFLRRNLMLELKDEATVLAPVSEGIPFLGLRLWPRLVRLDGPGKRRLIRALRQGRRGLASGRLTEEEIAPSLRSCFAHAAQADSLGLRRALIEEFNLGPGALRAPTG